MIALNLIRNDIKPLNPEDKVIFAHELMEEYKVQHLPVLENGDYIGLLYEDDLLDAAHDDLSVKKGSSRIMRTFLPSNKHLFDAIAMIGETKLSMLPVLDEDEKYIGYILPKDIVVEMGSMLSSRVPGGILVLEINQNDYQMSQIAQIIEGNDAKILASYLTSHPDSTRIEITLRINRKDLTPIIQTFQRYDYTISATFHESLHTADLKDRYENFMNYLNM
jgi:acetoin utilization protein AcuB